jgi:hypothetical protein
MTELDSTEFRFQQELFDTVTKAYRVIRSAHPLAASNPDLLSPPNKRLTFNSIDFKVDVERATAFALGGPNQAVLLRAWFNLVAEKPDVDPGIVQEVISRASVVYKDRSLDPADYFRPIRKGRRREDGCQ